MEWKSVVFLLPIPQLREVIIISYNFIFEKNLLYYIVLTFHLLKKIVSLARGNDEDEAVNFIGSATIVGGMMGAARKHLFPLLPLPPRHLLHK